MNISTEHSLWFIPLCLIIAAAYSYLLYGSGTKVNRPFSRKLRYLMASARFILAFLLLFLLLNPLLKTITEEREKPLFVIAHDRSESMILNADSTFIRDTLPEQTRNLAQRLRSDYKVDYIEFGSTVRTAQDTAYNDVHTDFEQLFSTINNRYIYSNLGGVVLISDGLYNRGRNPLYFPFDKPVTFFTVGAGDTAAHRDLAIKRINHNDITFLDNTFPVEIDIAAYGCKGEQSKLSIYKNGERKAEKQIEVGSEDYFKTFRFELEADEPGVVKYTVKAEHLSDELIYENNTREFYIEVIDNRNKILILTGTPSPDLGAIDRALSSVKTYETDKKILSNHTQTPELDEYNLVIAAHLGKKKFQGVIQNLKEADVPVLWKFGLNDDVNIVRSTVPGLSINSYKRSHNDVMPHFDRSFNLFTYDRKHAKVFNQVPPVRLAFADYELTGGLSALVKQKAGKVETNQPLLAFSSSGTKRYGVMLGDGYFRWQLHNFAQKQNTDAFNELIRKSASYLMSTEDKSRFRLDYDTRNSAADPFIMKAELYNPSYELVNDPDVVIEFTDEAGEQKEFTFSRTRDQYKLNRGTLPPGEYTFKAYTELGNDRFEKEGRFTVEDISIESEETVADFNLMRNMAEKTGGEFFYSREIEKLYKRLSDPSSAQTVLSERTKFSDIIELRWLFFVLLAFIGFEWFMRKYNGGY